MARVAAYLRRSSPGEEDKNTSLETQLEDITTWAEREGHVIVATFSDPGGKSDTLDRPALNDLMAQARKGTFDIVAVWKFDRFSRDQEQTIVAVFMLKQCAVKVVSITQPLPDGPIGTILLSTYQFGARLELDGIRERVQRGKVQRVHKGKLGAMSAPKYGYQFADRETKEKYLPDPITAPIVQRIFADYLAGETIRGIALRLSTEGILTPTKYQQTQGWRINARAGEVWVPATVFKILTDPAYTGHLVGMRKHKFKGPSRNPITGEVKLVEKRQLRPDDDPNRFEYGPDVCPPLISDDVFQAAQQRLLQRREMSSRNLTRPKEVLLRSPIGVCGHCGGGLSAGWHKRNQTHYYRCSNQIRTVGCKSPYNVMVMTKTLDEAVWSWFVDQLTHPERLQAEYKLYLENAGEASAAAASQRNAIIVAREQAETEENNYLAAVGTAKSEEMRARFVVLAEEAHTKFINLSKQLEDIIDEEAHRAEQAKVIASFHDAAAIALKKLEQATIEQRQLILYQFEVRAILWGKQHSPAYEFRWVFSDLSSDPSISVNTIRSFLAFHLPRAS